MSESGCKLAHDSQPLLLASSVRVRDGNRRAGPADTGWREGWEALHGVQDSAVLCALDLQMFVTQCLSNADCFFQEENHK